MTPMQKKHIQELATHNGILLEEVEKFSLEKFGKSLYDLNIREANRLIEILQEEPEEIIELSE